MTWWQALLAAGGPVAVAAIAGWWTKRTSEHATDKTAAVQEQANAISGFAALAKSLQEQIDQMKTERTEDRERLERLEEELRGERTTVDQLIDYTRRLRTILREHDIEAPEPPTAVRDKL